MCEKAVRAASSEAATSVTVIPASEVSHAQASLRRLRVAAYCRVSTDEERQLGSFENQVEHYTHAICENPSYQLAGIYSDEGISGTSTRRREGFNAMLADCEAGKIDLIITKSISRFARNTQDSLTYTRRLRDQGIGIYFEKEGINTLEGSGELLLTLFSCFAQEESRSISENTTWGIRSKFRQGIPHLNATLLLGYDKGADGGLQVNVVQAQVVRRVFRCYLEGWSLGSIARVLNDEGVPGVHGEARWCATTITHLLQNEKYKGDLLMQKTFTASYLTKRHVRNTGQLDQYYVAGAHPAIIDPEMWDAAQQEQARRRAFRVRHGLRGLYGGSTQSAFYARLFCRRCDRALRRVHPRGVWETSWICPICGHAVEDERVRSSFCTAFNCLVAEQEERACQWAEVERTGSALQRHQVRLLRDIVAGGPIPYELSALTRAVLEQAWLEEAHGHETLRLCFLAGDEVSVTVS